MKKKRIIAIILIAASIAGIIALSFFRKKEDVKYVEYNKFLEMVDNKEVSCIEYLSDDDYIYITLHNELDPSMKTENPKYEEFKKDMLLKGVSVSEDAQSESLKRNLISGVIMIVEAGFLILILLFAFKKFMGNAALQIQTESTKTFEDIAGLDEVKESIMVIVDMLKNPDKYKKAGARIPKGVLLYGPPGTGKTLLAKAIAGEAGVNFMAVNGADFENKYAGVGADNVRSLFKEAKKKAPCILFIDEIDAVGCKRRADGQSFERQTLNQLLSCMDGFDDDDGITVFAATNDMESLDRALLRPGRFDSRYAVGLPDTAEDRRAVIDLYMKNKKSVDGLDLDRFAKETIGCSPADIEAVVNEAAILSAKRDGIITNDDIDEAYCTQLLSGHKKKNRSKDSEDIKITAWHEAGHAIVGKLMGEDVSKVSIVSTTSGYGGFTIMNKKKMGLYSKKELEARVMSLYAGRNAEIILLGEENVTTGAANDIKEATALIKEMIDSMGMSDSYGLLDLSSFDDIPIEEYVSRAEELKNRSYTLLLDNKDILETLANELIKKETITEDELNKIIFSGNHKNLVK